jgi:hypothetical protein
MLRRGPGKAQRNSAPGAVPPAGKPPIVSRYKFIAMLDYVKFGEEYRVTTYVMTAGVVR